VFNASVTTSVVITIGTGTGRFWEVNVLVSQPRSQASAGFGCTKNAEGLVSFPTCMTSRVEWW